MKVLALGGSGDMGRMVVAVLLEFQKVTSITVADKDNEKAEHLVELIGSDKLNATEIDVERARQAIERARERLATKRGSKDIDYVRAEASLKRALMRLKVAEKTE